MSQFQPLFAPVYGGSSTARVHCGPRLVSGIRRAGTDVVGTAGRVKLVRRFSTRVSLQRRATRSEHGVLNAFHAVSKDFNAIFDEMKNQLSQCQLYVIVNNPVRSLTHVFQVRGA
jgi:hypothetical protein